MADPAPSLGQYPVNQQPAAQPAPQAAATPAAPAAPAAPAQPQFPGASSPGDHIDYEAFQRDEAARKQAEERQASDAAFRELHPIKQLELYRQDPHRYPMPTWMADPYPDASPDAGRWFNIDGARAAIQNTRFREAVDDFNHNHPAAPAEQPHPAPVASAANQPRVDGYAGMTSQPASPIQPGAAGHNGYQYHPGRTASDPDWLAEMGSDYANVVRAAEKDRAQQTTDDAFQSPFFQERLRQYSGHMPYEAAVAAARQDTANNYGIQSQYERYGHPATDTGNIDKQADEDKDLFARTGNVHSFDHLPEGVAVDGRLRDNGNGTYSNGAGVTARASAFSTYPSTTMGYNMMVLHNREETAQRTAIAKQQAAELRFKASQISAADRSKNPALQEMAIRMNAQANALDPRTGEYPAQQLNSAGINNDAR